MKISHQNARETRTDTQCSHTVPYATALHTHVTSHTCHGTSQLDLASARVAARYLRGLIFAGPHTGCSTVVVGRSALGHVYGVGRSALGDVYG